MNTVNKGLLGALGVQVALALFTNWPSSGPGAERDLLGFPTDQIQSISITGRKAHDEVPEAPVTLTHADSGWVISSAEDYPAKDDLVQPVLDALGKLKVHLPVATTADSQVNLEVADDTFTRMVEVHSKDGQTRKLYLGAGQGKTTHVRVDGEKETYDADGFTAWSVAETANRYFDRNFLVVDLNSVQSVTVQRPNQAAMNFVKSPDGNWTVNGLLPGQELDQSATASFVSSLVNVRMVDPAGKTVKPEMGFDGPNATVVTWTATPPAPEGSSADGSAPAAAPVTQSYRIGAEIPGKNGRYYLKSDTSPYVVEMLKGNVQNALEKPLDKLLVGATPPPSAPPGGPGGMPPGMGMPPGGPHGH
jgi:hypothetical protein